MNSFSSQPDKNRPILKSACSFLPLWGIERFSPEVGALVQGEQVMKMVEDAELRITSTGSESPSFVIGLANGKEAIVEALKKGCRAILQGNGMSESCLQRMAEEKVVWIPNLLSLKTLAEQESGKYTGEAMGLLKKQHAALVIAREKGVAIAMGTGAGSSSIIHGESAVEEMKLLKGAGLSLAEVLRCSGFVGADLLGCGNMGLLRKGYDATFLVSRGTAAQLPRKLSYLENIYIKGRPSIAYRKNPVKTFYKR